MASARIFAALGKHIFSLPGALMGCCPPGAPFCHPLQFATLGRVSQTQAHLFYPILLVLFGFLEPMPAAKWSWLSCIPCLTGHSMLQTSPMAKRGLSLVPTESCMPREFFARKYCSSAALCLSCGTKEPECTRTHGPRLRTSLFLSDKCHYNFNRFWNK